MKITSSSFQKITVAIIFLWLIIFMLAPNFLVFATSFFTRDNQDLIKLSFTLDNYTQLFDELYIQIFFNSLKMAGIATILCLVIGYPFAFIISKMKAKYRAALLFLLILPFWTNSLIRIYGIKSVLGVKGVLNNFLLWLGVIDSPLRILNSEIAVTLGLVYLLLPFMILPLYSSIEKLDIKLIEAARDLGAKSLQRFIKIILPLTLPGIISGCLLVLLPAMGMFYVSDLLGGSKALLIGNVIKSEFLITRNWPFGSVLSIFLTVIMAILLVAYYHTSKILNKKSELE